MLIDFMIMFVVQVPMQPQGMMPGMAPAYATMPQQQPHMQQMGQAPPGQQQMQMHMGMPQQQVGTAASEFLRKEMTC